MPEPPALNPALVTRYEGVGPASSDISIDGAPGAVTANASLRLTNLDGELPARVGRAAADGSFLIPVTIEVGQELRIQPLAGPARGTPADYVVGVESLEPSPRHSCVELEPSVGFAGPGREAVQIRNSCSDPVVLAAARQRLALPEFGLATPLPLAVEPGAARELEVAFSPARSGDVEETLFIDVDVAGRTIRYPITLYLEP